MEKQDSPVVKVVGATSLVPEKEEGRKEEAAATAPAKEEIAEGAVSDKPVSSKEDSASPSQVSLSITSGPNVVSANIEESPSVSLPESTSPEVITAPVRQITARSSTCIPNCKKVRICGVCALLCLALGIGLLSQRSKGLGYEIAGWFSIAVMLVLFCMIIYFVWRGYSSSPPTSDASDPSSPDEDRSDAGIEDIESRRVGSSGSEYLEATDKQQDCSDQSTAGPSKEGTSSSGFSSETQPMLQPTTSKSDSVMKLSEIASTVTQIASRTSQEGPEESVQEQPKDQNVGEKADDNLQKDSEPEGLSSSELRRRNFQNPDSCADLTLPSESKV